MHLNTEDIFARSGITKINFSKQRVPRFARDTTFDFNWGHQCLLVFSCAWFIRWAARKLDDFRGTCRISSWILYVTTLSLGFLLMDSLVDSWDELLGKLYYFRAVCRCGRLWGTALYPLWTCRYELSYLRRFETYVPIQPALTFGRWILAVLGSNQRE